MHYDIKVKINECSSLCSLHSTLLYSWYIPYFPTAFQVQIVAHSSSQTFYFFLFFRITVDFFASTVHYQLKEISMLYYFFISICCIYVDIVSNFMQVSRGILSPPPSWGFAGKLAEPQEPPSSIISHWTSKMASVTGHS